MQTSLSENCRLCGSSRVGLWERVAGRRVAQDRMFDYIKCEECQSVFLSRSTPTSSEIYGGDYFEGPKNNLISTLERIWSHLTHVLRRWRAPVRISGIKVLDIGCGTAGWLKFLNQHGCQVYGLEPSSIACEIAREKSGVEVICGTLEKHSFLSSSFDVITANHCLEHVPDPKAFVKNAVSLLKTEGWLQISIPNISSWEAQHARAGWFHLDPPYHECFPSIKALEELIRQVGCENLEVRCPISECPQSLLYAWFGREHVPKWMVTFALPVVLLAGVFFALQRRGGVVEIWARKR